MRISDFLKQLDESSIDKQDDEATENNVVAPAQKQDGSRNVSETAAETLAPNSTPTDPIAQVAPVTPEETDEEPAAETLQPNSKVAESEEQSQKMAELLAQLQSTGNYDQNQIAILKQAAQAMIGNDKSDESPEPIPAEAKPSNAESSQQPQGPTMDKQYLVGESLAESIATHLEEGTSFKLNLELGNLFESHGFESEFAKSASEIFEAAVNEVTKTHLAKVNAYASYLTEALLEAKVADMEAMVESKLNEATADWVGANKIAIEQGVRTQVAESFMEKMLGVLEEHFIEVPKSKADLYESAQEEIASTKSTILEHESKVELLEAELASTKKQLVLESFLKDCSLIQSERIKELASDLVFESTEAFTKKLSILKESYVDNKSSKKIEMVTEDLSPVVEQVSHVPSGDRDVLALAGHMSRYSGKI